MFDRVGQRFADGGEDVVAQVDVAVAGRGEKRGDGVPHRARGLRAGDAVDAQFGEARHALAACERSDEGLGAVVEDAKRVAEAGVLDQPRELPAADHDGDGQLLLGRVVAKAQQFGQRRRVGVVDVGKVEQDRRTSLPAIDEGGGDFSPCGRFRVHRPSE